MGREEIASPDTPSRASHRQLLCGQWVENPWRERGMVVLSAFIPLPSQRREGCTQKEKGLLKQHLG